MSDRVICRFCGAAVPPRAGEGTCRHCDPQGIIDHLEVLLAESRAACARLQEEIDHERGVSLNDPAEQRAERYGAEAMDLTTCLINAEAQVSTLTADMERHIERASEEIGRREQAQIAFSLSEQKRLQLIDRNATLTAALRRITEEDDSCGCDDHTSQECCNQASVYCPHCIAAAVLRAASEGA